MYTLRLRWLSLNQSECARCTIHDTICFVKMALIRVGVYYCTQKIMALRNLVLVVISHHQLARNPEFYSAKIFNQIILDSAASASEHDQCWCYLAVTARYLLSYDILVLNTCTHYTYTSKHVTHGHMYNHWQSCWLVCV